jgi:hypothetical protein
VNIYELKQGQNVTYCSFDSESPRTFLALHLALPMLQDLGGVFGVRGFSVQ